MQRFSDFCLKKIPQSMRDDPWTQAIFHGADYGMDSIIQQIRDLYVWEDFYRMPLDRLHKFEIALGVKYFFTDETRRRDTVRAYWIGWGSPSVDTIREIVELMTQHSAVVTYDQTNMQIIINSTAEDIPDDIRPALSELLRRHIPAWLGIQFGLTPSVTYMTVSDVDSAKVSAVKKSMYGTDTGLYIRKT